MTPVLAFAAWRGARACGLAAPLAVVAAVAAAALLGLAPALVFAREPSGLEPGGLRPADLQLTVEYLDGWSPQVEDDQGRGVRWMGRRARLAVGQLVATRPRASLEFEARAERDTNVVARLRGREIGSFALSPQPERVRVLVPSGKGPAVLELTASPAREQTMQLVLETVRATNLDAAPAPSASGAERARQTG